VNPPEESFASASAGNTPQPDSSQSDNSQSGLLPPEPNPSIQEYFQLQQELLRATLVFMGIIFLTVWFFYSINIALNYLIGACTGVVYLRMLARNVEQLGRQKDRIGKTHLAVFIGLIVLASQWDQLQILPIFLGFLTYKAAIIAYMFRILFASDS
jgi:ATP synthase protein I